MLEAGFATVDELKDRLRINDSDEDSLFTEILLQVSAAIERAVGRPLRRQHRRTEYFRGGEALIRTRLSHIAKVHSIRESSTRDFTTSGSYTELAEGTDYILESDNTGMPAGSSGFIRRLNGEWMGSKTSPGQVQVIYTGGFKTDAELALENGEVEIQSADRIEDFALRRSGHPTDIVYGINTEEDEEVELHDFVIGGLQTTIFGVLRFNISGLIMPSWLLTSIRVDYYARRDASASDYLTWNILGIGDDLLTGTLENAYDLGAAGVQLGTGGTSASTMASKILLLSDDDDIANGSLGLPNGHMTFVFKPSWSADESTPIVYIASSENSTAVQKPKLTVRHRVSTYDDFNVPDDLKRAALIQGVHDYKTRATPGLMSESARGVSIASGISRQMRPVNLLPAVEEIAKTYRRQR